MIRLTILALVGASLPLASSPGHPPPLATCALQLELIDRQTGKNLPGIVQVRREDGQPVELPELINRGQGIESAAPYTNGTYFPNQSRSPCRRRPWCSRRSPVSKPSLPWSASI